MFALENILQSKFDVTRRADRSGDSAERVQIAEVSGRRAETRSVGEIEELRAEVNVIAFADVELLANSEIPVDVTRSFGNADTGIGKERSLILNLPRNDDC